MQIKLTLSNKQVEQILNALGKMPLLEALDTFQSVSMQAQAQLKPPPEKKEKKEKKEEKN